MVQKRQLRQAGPASGLPSTAELTAAAYATRIFPKCSSGPTSDMRLIAMNRADSKAPPPPACDNCTREMVPVGALRAIVDRQAVRVYKCLPCQRIVSAPLRD